MAQPENPAPAVTRNRWMLVVAVGMVVFMATLDATIVTVALPSIEDTFGTPTGSTGWVVLGYVVPLIALALPSGRWLDTVDRRAAFVLALSGFALSSLVIGLAPTFELLVAGRVLQGAFGAVLFAASPVVATTAVSTAARGRAMGLVSTIGPLGAVTGPALGGVLVEYVDWRWIFYVNVPISAAIVAMAIAMMTAEGRLRRPDRTWFTEVLLLGGASVALLLAFSQAAESSFTWLALALAAVPLVAVWLRTPGSRPVVGLLRSPGITGAHVTLLTFAAASMTVLFLFPFYLQRELDLAPSQTGTTMLALPLGTALFGPVGGWLADRFGARQTTLTGTVGMVIGLLLLLPMGSDWSTVQVAWRLAVMGVASGLVAGPVMAIAMGRAPRELLGTVAASMSLVRQLGFALGSALAIVAWAIGGYELEGMRLGVGVALLAGLIGISAMARRPAER